MQYKKSIIASTFAFIVAASCCWLPALVIAIGGGTTLLGISNGIEQLSGVFMSLGVGLLGLGMYQYNKKNKAVNKELILQSSISCPGCGHSKKEIMPTNSCLFYYSCENCNRRLKPLEGDCCVFCSYGTVACPPIQLNQNCC